MFTVLLHLLLLYRQFPKLRQGQVKPNAIFPTIVSGFYENLSIKSRLLPNIFHTEGFYRNKVWVFWRDPQPSWRTFCKSVQLKNCNLTPILSIFIDSLACYLLSHLYECLVKLLIK